MQAAVWVILVVVVDPTLKLLQECEGIRTRLDASIISFQGFDEGFADAIAFRAANGRKAGHESECGGELQGLMGGVGRPIIRQPLNRVRCPQGVKPPFHAGKLLIRGGATAALAAGDDFNARVVRHRLVTRRMRSSSALCLVSGRNGGRSTSLPMGHEKSQMRAGVGKKVARAAGGSCDLRLDTIIPSLPRAENFTTFPLLRCFKPLKTTQAQAFSTEVCFGRILRRVRSRKLR